MAAVTATYRKPRPRDASRTPPDKVIRVGVEEYSRTFRLTVEEAERIVRELNAAIFQAKAARSGVHEPAVAPAEGGE
jgi:hypothetical protein